MTDRVSVVDWLLDSDPSIRWQVMRLESSRPGDQILTHAPVAADSIAASTNAMLRAPTCRSG